MKKKKKKEEKEKNMHTEGGEREWVFNLSVIHRR